MCIDIYIEIEVRTTMRNDVRMSAYGNKEQQPISLKGKTLTDAIPRRINRNGHAQHKTSVPGAPGTKHPKYSHVCKDT
ncbi:hypothetical protein KDA_44130 [Dictyobacter alpinus]|uniref:Uncharacterized protein n=2 Tax=Dictyobacter alpinus TaxID=2014873 RepID=A0A402BC61_9CHLR|nr:hypothetical protein KDA_44130 [Dictyobacter alpinus]